MVDELPVGNGHMPPGEKWVCDAPAEELRGNFREFGSDIQKLFSCVRNTSRWSIHHVYPPLRSYVRGKIALIGDSVRGQIVGISVIPKHFLQAHAMRTHLGAGAGQGLEDCYVLAKLLGHPSADVNNLEVASIQLYHSRRLADTEQISGNIARVRRDPTATRTACMGTNGHDRRDLRR